MMPAEVFRDLVSYYLQFTFKRFNLIKYILWVYCYKYVYTCIHGHIYKEQW